MVFSNMLFKKSLTLSKVLVTAFLIAIPNSLPKFLRGSRIFFLPHSVRSSKIFLILSLAGLRIPFLIAPTRLPFLGLSGSPNTNLWNAEVEVSNPAPAPRTAFPSKPNGPIRIPAIAPTPIAGTDFLKNFLAFSAVSLEISPSLPVSASPNTNFLKLSLFFRYPIPAPIAAPPRTPKGVSNPRRPPAIPKSPMSLPCFLKISTTDLGMTPPLRFPSSSFSPNSMVLRVSLF